MITIYEKPHCPQCTAVKNRLNKENIPYNTAPIDDEILDLARSRGWTQAPIVLTTHGGDFFGNNEQAIEQLIKTYKE